MSHTSTDQWQSFEIRMRQRRAERCRLRALLALQAGFPEDARTALDEARGLDGSIPDFETFAASIEPVTQPRRLRPLATLALIGAAIVAAGDTRPAVDVTPASIVAAVPPPPATPQPSVRVEQISVPASVENTRTEQKSMAVAVAKPAPVAAVATRGISEPLPASAPLTPVEHATPTALPDLGSANLDPPSVDAEPDQEPRVRAVLARYERAYSTLDAHAARTVWPTVDTASLARAFDALASQRVSLGACAVTLEGATANAECRGTASWTPKVGSGTHSGSRTWQFRLQNDGGEWHIVRAQMR